MEPYDYSQRSGVEPVSWERFEQLVRILAEQSRIVRAANDPWYRSRRFISRHDAVVYSATRILSDSADTATSTILSCAKSQPGWCGPPEKVVGRRVLLVDEIADSG